MEKPRRGVSLIEALLAVTILGSAATMYGSAWSSTFGANDAARSIELGTELFVRECALLRRGNPKGSYPAEVPFFERAFQDQQGLYQPGCAPPNPGTNEAGTTYYRSPPTPQGGGNDLSYNTPLDKLLDTPGTNCFEIPPGTPNWNPTLPSSGGVGLADLGFAVRVFASRVQASTGTGVPRPVATLNGTPGNDPLLWLNQLIRYRVVVLRNNQHVVSGEFLVEVR